jgi:hypothetical protein
MYKNMSLQIDEILENIVEILALCHPFMMEEVAGWEAHPGQVCNVS